MIELKHLHIAYDRPLIQDGTLKIYPGQVTLISGPSGSGKSTLLYRLGFISQDTQYQYLLNQENMMSLSQEEKTHFRRFHIGYVMQDNALFEHYDILEHLKLYDSLNYSIQEERELLKYLEYVDLKMDPHQKVETLSGGEKQRLAIACALCKNPEILILDEPTSALDLENENTIGKILKRLAHDEQKTVIIASHSPYLKEYADTCYTIKDKQIILEKACFSEEKHSILQRTKKLSYTFYLRYIHYFMKKYSMLNSLIVLATIASLLVSSFAIEKVMDYSLQSQQALFSLSDFQLFVSEDNPSGKVEDCHQIIDQDLLSFFQENHLISSIYPYISIQATSYYMPIYILPLYPENHLTDQLQTTSSKEGIYISQELYRYLKNSGFDTNHLPINYFNQTMSSQNEKTFPIKGVFKQGYQSPYVHSPQFIYMDLSMMQSLVSFKDELAIGYTLFTESFDDLVTLRNQLQQMDLSVNEDFISISYIQNIQKKLHFNQYLLISLCFTTTLILLSVLTINYFYKREKEFALLNIHGLNKNQLNQLVFLETLIKSLFCFFIYFILKCPFKQPGIFFISSMLLLAMGIVSISIHYLKIHQLIPENILRQ